MKISATNEFLSHQDGRGKKYPCCTEAVENTEHIVMRDEAGCVEAFQLMADAMGKLMDSSQTDPDWQSSCSSM